MNHKFRKLHQLTFFFEQVFEVLPPQVIRNVWNMEPNPCISAAGTTVGVSIAVIAATVVAAASGSCGVVVA